MPPKGKCKCGSTGPLYQNGLCRDCLSVRFGILKHLKPALPKISICMSIRTDDDEIYLDDSLSFIDSNAYVFRMYQLKDEFFSCRNNFENEKRKFVWSAKANGAYIVGKGVYHDN